MTRRRKKRSSAPPYAPSAAPKPSVDNEAFDDAADSGTTLGGEARELAAQALHRLRQRARTDLAELRVQYQKLDGLVIVFALALVIAAGYLHRRLVTPPTVTFAEHGLSFARSTSWLAPEPVPTIAPRLLRDPDPHPRSNADELPYRVSFTSAVDSDAHFEVLIDAQPAWSNIVTGLELDRRTRWGELYSVDDSAERDIAGHDWLRTAYRYAHIDDKGDQPRIGRAVEYATVDRERLYVVTFFGTPDQLAAMERVIAPSLRTASRTGLPLLPQVGRLSKRDVPAPVANAYDATVMIVVADLIDGRLRARGGGSGVIVSGDGSILTNFHVIHDHDGRLHDLFIIGRYAGPDKPPMLMCAGKPSRSKLQRDLDLALIKCDTDLDGRAWNPTEAGRWPALNTITKPQDMQPGERLWVLGYPDVGGGGLTLSQGLVEGMTGEDGGLGQDYIKTDASITHGNSGGPVLDDAGHLIGLATAFRIRVDAAGGVVETAKVGLVRPMTATADLLAIAGAGWTPRDGHTSVELEPQAVDAPAEGIHISTKILDAANDAPVAGALLMVLRSGVSAAAIDVNRLDELVLSWGRSNADGEVHLKQPVPAPGTYTVMVVARRFAPLAKDGELVLTDKSPTFFDPWGQIRLESK